MARYIDADYMKKVVDMHGTNKYGMLDENIRIFIDQIPTADVRENRHGAWKYYGEDFYGDYEYKCTACENTANYETDFCPNCGADMRGEKDGEFSTRN